MKSYIIEIDKNNLPSGIDSCKIERGLYSNPINFHPEGEENPTNPHQKHRIEEKDDKILIHCDDEDEMSRCKAVLKDREIKIT